MDHDRGLEAVGDAREEAQVVGVEGRVVGGTGQVHEGDGGVHALSRDEAVDAVDVLFIEVVEVVHVGIGLSIGVAIIHILAKEKNTYILTRAEV